ncbi:MAG: hypothetical protein M1814_001091 [Vezdaea aestivalis]|nr:MAG: hypothetical protein M1814_001091 [Vezdaea aestivalis]
MPLLSLPPEILLRIFDYIGSSYFRSDVSRLTVCKEWSRFARDACFRDLHVIPETLRRLLSSPYLESSLPLVKDSMEILDLELKGFEDWDSISLSQHDTQVQTVATASILDGAHGRAVRAAWTTELNNDLLYLASIVEQSRRLCVLRIYATSELHPFVPLLERRDYLFRPTVCAFFSISSLTSLELDLCGTRIIQEYGEGFHICTDIAALLTTLRRLQVRMRSICADVLKPRQHCTTLRLEELIINLSLSDESLLTTSTAHATCCGSSTGGFLQLKADLEKQAQVLVTQMAAPKMVRILTHILPSIQIRAFDVLTSKTVALSKDAEWDDKGETMEDQVSDEESEISDLSTDDNT